MKIVHGCPRWVRVVALAGFVAVTIGPAVHAQAPDASIDNPFQIPDVSNVAPPATTPEGITSTLQILVLMTVLSLAPSILIMTTSFVRVIVVLALVRQALGTPQLPPAQVITALALFITFLVMAPTWQNVYDDAIEPYLNKEEGMTQRLAFERAAAHMRAFMFRQIENAGNESDVYLFVEYSQQRNIPADEVVLRKDVPTTALIPAFMLSELKAAFVMGFRVYLPFLVVDMVIASILISMGMLMLPPVLISLPFKILLFILADGWHLVVGSLLESFV